MYYSREKKKTNLIAKKGVEGGDKKGLLGWGWMRPLVLNGSIVKNQFKNVVLVKLHVSLISFLKSPVTLIFSFLLNILISVNIGFATALNMQ